MLEVLSFWADQERAYYSPKWKYLANLSGVSKFLENGKKDLKLKLVLVSLDRSRIQGSLFLRTDHLYKVFYAYFGYADHIIFTDV